MREELKLKRLLESLYITSPPTVPHDYSEEFALFSSSFGDVSAGKASNSSKIYKPKVQETLDATIAVDTLYSSGFVGYMDHFFQVASRNCFLF